MNLDSLCTCGSELPLKECCFKTIDTTPKGPKTNYAHPKCYAMELCDCSPTISKEHYFSKSVMDLWGKEAKVGAPFIKGDGKFLKLSSLSAKILCERHNHALSSLDELAKKFFKFVLFKTEYEYLVIRGADLERWLLKVMCGFIATGYAQTITGKFITAKLPPLAQLNVLFGRSDLPNSLGLVIPTKDGNGLPNELGVIIHADDMNTVSFVEVRLNYIRLFLFLHDIQEMKKNIKNISHRPECFGLTVNNVYREVHFGWGKGDYVTVNITIKNL